jgi:hypothetical protein
MRPTVLLSAALLLPGGLAAQAHPLIGRWDVSVPVGKRVENGEAEAVVAKGSLLVTQVGDSLIATLKVTPPEGMPERPATRMASKAGVGAVTFVTRSDAKINMNGEESTHTSVSTWTFTVDSDTLKGSVSRVIEGLPEGMGMADPQQVTGKRVK